MAADLATAPDTGLMVQLCGDAHLSNFGGFASPERDMLFDVNDFDETAPGPFEWDLKRLAASLEVSGRALQFDNQTTRAIVVGAVRGYQEAMRTFALMSNIQVWYTRLDVAAATERWGGAIDTKTLQQVARRVTKAQHKDQIEGALQLTRVVGGNCGSCLTLPCWYRSTSCTAKTRAACTGIRSMRPSGDTVAPWPATGGASSSPIDTLTWPARWSEWEASVPGPGWRSLSARPG